MRMTIILASICFFLMSCSTFNSMIGGDTPAEGEQQVATDGAAAPSLEAPAPAGDASYASSPDIGGDPGHPSMEVQAAEQQTAQVDTMNEQRSSSELDAASPDTSATGTDNFYASSHPAGSPEVEQVTESSPMPSELPQKQVASWDQHTDSSPSYQEEKPVKKSKKIAKKKHDKKKIAKHSKKSKKEIAKHSKKSKKSLAKNKKSKVDCKKVAKHTKKSSKREIAMCKAEIKKIAKHSKKSQKNGKKLAQAGCQCNYR